MRDKEDRLSPRAKKLLEGVRRKFSQNPGAARQYLQSISPRELTMYDRLKIGREILSRAPPMSILFNQWELEEFQNKIQEAYGLPITKWNMDSHKYEPVEPLIGKARIHTRQVAVRCEREMIENISSAREHGYYKRFWDGSDFDRRIADEFGAAVKNYTLLGMTDNALRCYEIMLEDIRRRIEEGNYWCPGGSDRYVKFLEKERDNLVKNKK